MNRSMELKKSIRGYCSCRIN